MIILVHLVIFSIIYLYALCIHLYIILYFHDTIVLAILYLFTFFKTHKGKNNTFFYLLEISLNNITCPRYVTKKRDGNT